MSNSSTPYALILLLILSAGLFAWHAYWGLWSDVIFYLASSERILAGGRLYVDIIDMNPPLAFWLTIPFVKLAQSLFFDAATVYLAGMFALIWASTAMTWILLSRTIPNSSYRLKIAVVLFLAIALPAGPAFGQREHLTIILLLPYLVLASGRIQGYPAPRLFALLVGLFAGIGIGLKPYFLPAIIFVEIIFMVYRRNVFSVFRPEALATLLFLISYLAAAVIFMPEYFRTILPLALSTYSAFDKDWGKIWLSSWLLITIIPWAFAAFLLYFRIHKNPLPALMMAASTGFLLGFFLQKKGFYYHIYPAHSLASMALLCLWLAPAQTIRTSTLRNATIVAVVMAPFIMLHIQWISFNQSRFANEANLLGKIEPARSVMIFSHDIGLAFPFIRANKKKWASSFPALWPLLGISQAYGGTGNQLSERQRWAFDFVKNKIAQDLKVYKPDIVLVDNRQNTPTLRGHPVPYLKLLSTDDQFNKQWAFYQKSEEIFSLEIWRRTEAKGAASKATN